MDSTVLGALSALVATALFSAGLVLQASETRKVGSQFSLRLSLVGQLASQRRWVLGTVVTCLGYPFHVAALLLAPLTVVQPALVAGLLVLLAIGARTRGETVGPRDIAGVGAIIVGVVAMTVTAPDRGAVETQTGPLVAALVVLTAITLAPYGLRRLPGRAGQATTTSATVAAGTGYALAGITTKLAADQLGDGALIGMLSWLIATAIVGGLAFLAQLTALQHRSATQVGPVIYVVPVLVPVLLAPFLTGESWGATPLGGGAMLASLLVVCVGAALVSSSPSVGRATEREAAEPAG